MQQRSTSKTAILCGYYGQDNIGDEALLMTLMQMLPPNIQPLVLSANPQKTKETLKVAAIPNRSAFPILEAMQKADYFIWGGGSLMQDVTSFRSPIYYGGLMALAQQRGLKTIAWAQGVGPLKSAFSRWLTRKTLIGCDQISVRDRASVELLSTWGLSPLIAPDPVWALESEPFPELWQLPAPRVAVTLRQHPQLTRAKIQALTNALISFQKATDTCILLVPFQPQDQSLAEEIASQLPDPKAVICGESPTRLKRMFRGVEMAIGMRYHSLIMAACEECKCFALSYDPKISQLMTEFEIPGWELSNIPDDPNIITKAWLECYANGEGLTPDQIQSQRDRALMHQDLLLKY
ncbi:MAG: polysaccharide pyruvyl transferase CsaB [Halothece sp. Uz-M2-17]|nr:polysaccharide pyruvyl transferase CsaB [Halothece sp. Uz-M2-17]